MLGWRDTAPVTLQAGRGGIPLRLANPCGLAPNTHRLPQHPSMSWLQRLVEKIMNMASPGIATCAINVSNALQGSPNFPNVIPGTFWPGNLFRDAVGVEPGLPVPSPFFCLIRLSDCYVFTDPQPLALC